MTDAFERLKTYEEGLRDGFLKGQEKANKVMEQMLHTSCNPIAYALPETEAIKLLKEQLTKAKEILEEVCNTIPASVAEYWMSEPLSKAREFLREIDK